MNIIDIIKYTIFLCYGLVGIFISILTLPDVNASIKKKVPLIDVLFCFGKISSATTGYRYLLVPKSYFRHFYVTAICVVLPTFVFSVFERSKLVQPIAFVV